MVLVHATVIVFVCCTHQNSLSLNRDGAKQHTQRAEGAGGLEIRCYLGLCMHLERGAVIYRILRTARFAVQQQKEVPDKIDLAS